MNKKALLNIIMILSLVPIISCKSNSEPEQKTITIKKEDVVNGIKNKGIVGKAGENESGLYDFSTIEDIANGKTDPEKIIGKDAENSTSKSKTATLMTQTFEESEFYVEGVDIKADVSDIASAQPNTPATLVLTITPSQETKEKKFIFDSDLTSSLNDSKLTIEIESAKGADWGN